MATELKQKPLPHPTDARKAAGFSWRGLAAAGPFSQATIADCERSGRYPLNRGTRMLYMFVLGLPTTDLDAPVAPKAQP